MARCAREVIPTYAHFLGPPDPPLAVLLGYRRVCVRYQVSIAGSESASNAPERNVYFCQLCLKAQLPRDAWKSPDAKLFVFTGQVFGEKELGRQKQ